jgi:SPP1 family predicted phage head-tail adaptor
MRAGLLRQRVTLQARAVTRDATGAEVETWADFAPNVPAAVEPLSGREFWASQSVTSSAVVKVTLRHLDGVTVTHRVWWQGKAWNLRSVADPTGRREVLVLVAECVE